MCHCWLFFLAMDHLFLSFSKGVVNAFFCKREMGGDAFWVGFFWCCGCWGGTGD